MSNFQEINDDESDIYQLQLQIEGTNSSGLKNLIDVNDLGDVTLFKLLKNRKNKKKIFIKVLDLLFKVQKIKKFNHVRFAG